MAFLAAIGSQIVGLVGMGAVMGGIDGVKSANEVTDLRNSLCDLNKKVKNIADQYKAIETSQEKAIQTLQENLSQNVTTLTTLKDEITITHEKYKTTTKQMEINAILFVLTLGLLYVIAKFKLLKLLFKAI